MHLGNKGFLNYLKKKYPESFRGAVLELGSQDVNGSIRPWFTEARKYVGVDLCPGKGVDIVSKAAETKFRKYEFDTLACFSMFEHDPDWKRSFSHNLQWLKPGGMIFLCWGAEGNTRHDPEPWALVPVADWDQAAKSWPIEVVEGFFEKKKFNPDCKGAFDVIARRLPDPVTFSIIMPTLGRPSLAGVMGILVPQLSSGDEVFVIGDGPTPSARAMMEFFVHPGIHYEEMGPIWNWGNPQRNWGMERAKKDFLVFLDDDDEPVPGGLNLVRKLIAPDPSKPHVFRVSLPWGTIPTRKEIVTDNLSGQCVIFPNDPERLGRWTGRYAADFDFIKSTLAHYKPGEIVWHDEIVCTVKPAGRGTIGREIP